MTKLTSKKDINMLSLLFAVTYMISYITRINYGAVIVEMERATGFSKSLLSMAVTGSFVTYGAGQVISGICGDRISPKKLVSCGLALTVFMNLLIPVCKTPYQMLPVWCINGFAQSFMWPPIVKLMTTLLHAEDYKKVTTQVSWGSSLGAIFVYLVSPLLISLWGWKSVFIFSAVCGMCVFFIWNKYSYEIDLSDIESKSKTNNKTGLRIFFTPIFIGIILAIILQGMLRDGVTTWMPSYIADTYNLSNTISILTGVILPVFGLACISAASVLYRKLFKNPLVCAGVFFAVGAVSSLLLRIFTGSNAAFSVLFSALLTGCMHGVNLILICMIPPFYKKYGIVSTVSGVLNACTYIGSAVSTYGIAVISENFGWNYTLLIWFLIAALGTFISFICVKPWNSIACDN